MHLYELQAVCKVRRSSSRGSSHRKQRVFSPFGCSILKTSPVASSRLTYSLLELAPTQEHPHLRRTACVCVCVRVYIRQSTLLSVTKLSGRRSTNLHSEPKADLIGRDWGNRAPADNSGVGAFPVFISLPNSPTEGKKGRKRDACLRHSEETIALHAELCVARKVTSSSECTAIQGGGEPIVLCQRHIGCFVFIFFRLRFIHTWPKPKR